MQIETFTGSVSHIHAIPSKSRINPKPFQAWEQSPALIVSKSLFFDIDCSMTWRQIREHLSDEHYFMSLEDAVAASKRVMMSAQDDGLRAPDGRANLFPFMSSDAPSMLNACFPNSVIPYFILKNDERHYWHFAEEGNVPDVPYYKGARVHIALSFNH